MRRIIVFIMLILLAVLITINVNIANLIIYRAPGLPFEKYLSYFHFLVFVKFGTELVALYIGISLITFLFWSIQLWKTVKPWLLRSLTSICLLFYVFYIGVIVSALLLFLENGLGDNYQIGSPNTVAALKLFELLNQNNTVAWFAYVVFFTIALLLFPIYYTNIVAKPDKKPS